MTNAEKYKTAKERGEAFGRWALTVHHCDRSRMTFEDAFNWLDLEAKSEEPLPCPFCGCKVQVIHDTNAIVSGVKWLVNCYGCQYEYGADTKEKLIAAHNRVARAVKEANDANA